MIMSDELKDEIVAFTVELVRLSGDSGNEGDAAALVHQKMKALGYDEVIIDRYGSVIGILKGSRPGPTLLFDGHTDVVPVREQSRWEHDPYGAEISDSRIWGRGTSDMKGALAAMICVPASLKRSDFKGRIIVCASVAEERLIGTALDHILEHYAADAVVIGEPTGLKLGVAEKGRASIEMVCQGTVAHSSRPDLGDNAVYRMTEAIARIRALPRRSHPLLGEEVIELVEISSLPSPGNGSIPGSCRALWECRLLQGESRESFLARWHRALEGLGRTEIRIAEYALDAYTGETMTMDDFLPGWLGEELDQDFMSLVSASINECGLETEHYAAPYGCNALISAGRRMIPTVILGPGDIALAHKPNENILIDQLIKAARIYGMICHNYLNRETW